ncbi:MAG: formimidoylglutamase [Cyclobacteriaceae bacterium]
MDLKLFLDPISKEITATHDKTSALANSFYINEENFPDIDDMDIAIIGIKEARGAAVVHQEGIAKSADEIRQHLYSLKKGSGNLKVVDLGNLRNGPELEDSYQRLKEVTAFLLEQNVLPIFIGGSHNMDIGQYQGYESQDKLISLLSIDNKLDLSDPKTSLDDDAHIHKIFKHDPNYLFNYTQLGYQSYLVDQKETELLEKLYFEGMRLGVIKENVKELEPTIRDADMISFDLSALQAHYAPGATDSKVYGLTGEESCQLCWYAGLNDKLSSIGFYGYDVNRDTPDKKTGFVLATMIWYFLEGYYNRKGDSNFHSDDYLVYEVSLGGDPSSIKFHKSKVSEKWWMEIPNPNEDSGFIKSRMIPCSYSDYETALDGEVPGKWIKTYSKMV